MKVAKKGLKLKLTWANPKITAAIRLTMLSYPPKIEVTTLPKPVSP